MLTDVPSSLVAVMWMTAIFKGRGVCRYSEDEAALSFLHNPNPKNKTTTHSVTTSSAASVIATARGTKSASYTFSSDSRPTYTSGFVHTVTLTRLQPATR